MPAKVIIANGNKSCHKNNSTSVRLAYRQAGAREAETYSTAGYQKKKPSH